VFLYAIGWDKKLTTLKESIVELTSEQLKNIKKEVCVFVCHPCLPLNCNASSSEEKTGKDVTAWSEHYPCLLSTLNFGVHLHQIGTRCKLDHQMREISWDLVSPNLPVPKLYGINAKATCSFGLQNTQRRPAISCWHPRSPATLTSLYLKRAAITNCWNPLERSSVDITVCYNNQSLRSNICFRANSERLVLFSKLTAGWSCLTLHL
jgi:hypothetical protein